MTEFNVKNQVTRTLNLVNINELRGGINFQNVRQNPRNWRIDEIVVEYDNFGRTRQENVLIHQSANLNDYDQTGKLNLAGNPIYQASRFSAEEQAQINQALNINQQQAQIEQPPYKWSWQ